MRRFLVPLVILVLLGTAVVVGAPILERHQRTAQFGALRSQLAEARVGARSCRGALALQEEEFLRFDRQVDSQRAVVEDFVDSEQGGVPEAAYEEYLEAFDLYNEWVETWQARADTLQASEARCRALIETHNQLRDSIEALRDAWSG